MLTNATEVVIMPDGECIEGHFDYLVEPFQDPNGTTLHVAAKLVGITLESEPKTDLGSEPFLFKIQIGEQTYSLRGVYLEGKIVIDWSGGEHVDG